MWNNSEDEGVNMQIRKAVIITTESEKSNVQMEMMPLIDRPLFQYVIDEIEQSGIEEVLVVVGKNSDTLINHFKNHTQSRVTIYFMRIENLTNYAEAILSAKYFVGNEPFVLLNSTQVFTNQTEPVTKQIIEAYKYLKHSVLAMQEKSSIFEVIEAQLDEEEYYSINRIHLEACPHENATHMNFCGRSVLRPDIFNYLEGKSEKGKGYYNFIEALDLMMADQKFYGVLIKGEPYDLMKHSGYIKCMIDLALDRSDLRGEIEKHIGERVKHIG